MLCGVDDHWIKLFGWTVPFIAILQSLTDMGPTLCYIQYIPYYLCVSAVFCESSFPCNWPACGRTTSCWLIGRAPLAWGCFLWSSASGFTWSSGQWCHSEWPPSSCLSGSLGQESNPCLRNIQHVSRCKLTSYSWELFHCLTKPQWLFLRLPGVSQGFGHQFLRTSSVILVGACLLCRATILNVLQVPSRLF